MKNQRKAWLAAGLLALGAAACFSDPTSDLRSGPAALTVNFLTVSVAAGDSVTLIGTVVDAQGNPLPVGAVTWTSADANVAVVNVDTIAKAPGDIFTRAYVRGISNGAGVTNVTVTAQGVTNTVRVTVLPKTFPGTVSVSGTVGPDTIILNRPSPLPPLVTPFTAGDTLVLDASPTVTFSATSSTVSFGPFPGYIVSRTATQIKAISRQAYAGKVTVTNLFYAGDATTGPIAIASLQTDSIALQHGRFRGTTVLAASAFGPNTQMTITAPAGLTFNATSATVTVGSTAAIVLSRTTTVITAIIAANLTGSVMVTGSTVGSAVTDSLRAGTLTTVAASFFPGTVTTANGTGALLDTIYVNAGGGATFTATGTTPAPSVVTIGTVPTLVVGTRTTTLLKVLAGRGVTGAVSITNVVVAGVTIPSLQTQANTVVSTTVSGQANEPANDNPGGTLITLGTAAAPNIIYGSVSDATDPNDFFTYTTAATTTVTLQVAMVGTGGGGSVNPDIDLLVCTTTLCNAFSGGGGGATGAQPENLVITNQVAGTYHIWVGAYDTGGTMVSYRLTARGP